MALALQFDKSTEDLIFASGRYAPLSNTPQEVIVESGQKTKAKADAVVMFADWLQKEFPEVYAETIQSRPDLLMPEFAMSGLAGFGQDPATTSEPTSEWGKAVKDFISNVLGPIAGVYQQKRIIDLNIKRAEQGLAPLEAGQFAPTVNVGVTPEVKQAGMIAGLALLGVIAVLVTRKR